MTTEEIKDAHARVIERNRPFEAILGNPDFVEWQKAGPIAELKAIQDQIVSIKRTDPDWKEDVAELVISYQAIARVLLLTVQKSGEAIASRKALKDSGTA